MNKIKRNRRQKGLRNEVKIEERNKRVKANKDEVRSKGVMGGRDERSERESKKEEKSARTH